MLQITPQVIKLIENHQKQHPAKIGSASSPKMDIFQPVQLPSVETFRQLQGGVVKIGKAMARLDNKMSCFLCCRRKWQLCQVVLLQTDTRLIIIYTDIDKGRSLIWRCKNTFFTLPEKRASLRLLSTTDS